ncbi:MAG TPA: DUF92 domain-containing protein [Terriglobales bacterium]|nr:DUF92 domain-containing protein [Terriglobales bacterium]
MSHLQLATATLGWSNGAQIALFGLTTVGFAAAARLLRGVTVAGATVGGAVCFLLMLAAGWGGFAALCTVFVMTWAATRVGYRRKQQIGSAERRVGRNAGQVLANLGVSAVAALLCIGLHDPRLLLPMAAALSEVAADTLSSEIGTFLGGTPRLVTTWEAVSPGTDGAITWLGTLVAVSAALVVGLVCAATRVFAFRTVPLCTSAAIFGTLVDSLLGATLERRGILKNNGVNFLSTAIAATLAWFIN